MKALLQRVKNAQVETEGKILGKINAGILIFLGVTHGDSEIEIEYLVEKIINLRIFEDSEKKMNLSLLDLKGELLVVSQFTLYADCKKGRRPSFVDAAPPEKATELYKKFIQRCTATGLTVQQGEFGADMEVSLINDGPVTIMLDTAV